jgi:hypothetical protein
MECVYRSSVRVSWRECSLTGGPEGHIKKALEMGISFRRGPTGEDGEEVHSLGTSRQRRH